MPLVFVLLPGKTCQVYRRLLQVVPIFFFQAEDGIRDVERSRGLGDVYKRQSLRKQSSLVLAKMSETDRQDMSNATHLWVE